MALVQVRLCWIFCLLLDGAKSWWLWVWVDKLGPNRASPSSTDIHFSIPSGRTGLEMSELNISELRHFRS